MLDPATRSTAGYRIWSILAGPLNALLIGLFLTSAEQGLYYSFGSLAQLIIYLELGLGFALQQLVSHEFSRLRYGPNGAPEGDPEALDRLRGIMRWALRWYAGIAIITLILLPTGGWLFLSGIPGISELDWTMPWVLLGIWVGFSVLWTPCWPLLEGSDRVAQLYRFRLRQGVFARLTSWVSLTVGYGLWAPVIERIGLGTQALVWLGRKHRPLLRSAFETPKRTLVRWRSHVWPLQWRLGLSTAGGFTVFALLIPALLWAQGPEEAGKLGMSLALVNAIYTVSHGLAQARQPTMAMAAARKNLDEMEGLFFSRFRWALGLYGVGCACLWVLLVLTWSVVPEIPHRLLSPLETTVLMAAMGIRLGRDLLNLYGRSFKQEPFFRFELYQGGLAIALLPWAATHSGAEGMMLAWLGINLVLVVPNTIAFRTFRRRFQGRFTHRTPSEPR